MAVALLTLAACPAPVASRPLTTPTTVASVASTPASDDELRPGNGLRVTAAVRGDGSTVDIVARVSTAHAARLRVGLIARFETPAFPDKVWMARVSAIVGDRVHCSMSNVERRLTNGMVGKLFVDRSPEPLPAPDTSASRSGE